MRVMRKERNLNEVGVWMGPGRSPQLVPLLLSDCAVPSQKPRSFSFCAHALRGYLLLSSGDNRQEFWPRDYG